MKAVIIITIIYSCSKDGKAQLNSTVPDTITTWNAEAVALNRATGLGISELSQITVSKDFFVSLELPYSINFGETVTIVPLVFYYGTKDSISVSKYYYYAHV